MRRRTNTWPIVLLPGVCLVAAVLLGQSSGTIDPERVELIKAGMVVNFLKYTEWPARSFTDEQSPVIITVVGGDCLNDVLERAVVGQYASGRRIQVRRVTFPISPDGRGEPSTQQIQDFFALLHRSHAVFICDSQRHRTSYLLNGLAGADVLTVSDTLDFAEAGGMLGLTVRGQRVAFDANPDEIRRTQLRVSSQVLRLARIVKTRNR